VSEPEEFSLPCDWCHIEVVSFVGPPAMIEVTANPGLRHPKQFWRICLPCYTEWIKLIARLDWLSTAPDRRTDAPANPY